MMTSTMTFLADEIEDRFKQYTEELITKLKKAKTLDEFDVIMQYNSTLLETITITMEKNADVVAEKIVAIKQRLTSN